MTTTPDHDVPDDLARTDPAMHRLLVVDLVPDVEVTFMVDGLTLNHQDLHQVTGALEAWLSRNQGAVVRLSDVKWDADREGWLVPVPGSIVAHCIETGRYEEHVDYYVGHRQVSVDIAIEWPEA